MTPTATPTAAFVLWYRPCRGQPWEAVGEERSEKEASAAMWTCGRRNDHWLTLVAGRHPDGRKDRK